MGIEVLGNRPGGRSQVEAELLLAHLLGLQRIDLHLHRDRFVDGDVADRYRNAVEARVRGVPVQYLMVDSRALIPRPETEVLVQAVIDEIRNRLPRPVGGRIDLLEIGTGSGAICCALAQEFSNELPIRIVATDISQDALDLAAGNIGRLGFEQVIELRPGDAFAPIGGDELFSAVVSNPPYVRCSDREALPEEIRDHEPEIALFSGETGLELIEILAGRSRDHLLPGGFLALELGMGQHGQVERLLRQHGFSCIIMKKDLTGVKRIALASDKA
jgi:release factor glutamine methyltransferase